MVNNNNEKKCKRRFTRNMLPNKLSVAALLHWIFEYLPADCTFFQKILEDIDGHKGKALLVEQKQSELKNLNANEGPEAGLSSEMSELQQMAREQCEMLQESIVQQEQYESDIRGFTINMYILHTFSLHRLTLCSAICFFSVFTLAACTGALRSLSWASVIADDRWRMSDSYCSCWTIDS
jgi:hypothetical protein